VSGFSLRLATEADLAALEPLMTRAIDELLPAVLSPELVAASHEIMGLDRLLIADRTYFVAETADGVLAGGGGWSRRATLFGSDHTYGRDPALLDPAREPARIRAMYTHPEFTRRGIGRAVLQVCEAAAAAEGFRSCELAATLSGAPLYLACGYEVIEPFEAETSTGARVPLYRMRKPL
jgi:GNAT superfamily N-acetyltransferase